MTTRTAPDYYLELDLSLKEFRAIRGTSFSVKVEFRDDRHIDGELIIPEFNDFPEFSKRVQAWLWLNEPIELEPGAEVKIILKEPSEYMITEQEYTKLMTYQGLAIKGSLKSDT